MLVGVREFIKMQNELLVVVIVFLPIFGAFFLPLIGSANEKMRNIFALLMVVTAFLASLMLLPEVMRGTVISVSFPFIPALGLFHADLLAVFMAIVSSMVGSIIILYSFEYISHYENRNEYYFMVVLFLGAMMGLVFSRNLLFLYLFWEITAIVCWRLIGFFREKKYVLMADKAFIVTVFGALMMLIGFLMIYEQAGSFDLGTIKENMKGTPISNVAVFFILFGIFSKSATLPLHTWLPDAGVAPSPVTALLHAAVLVKIGVYVFARLFVATLVLDDIWHTLVPFIAAVSALITAGAAFIETDIKRIIAYSTISQLGFILLGLSVNTELGIAGGLLYILMHGIAKGGLFLCAGIVEQKTKVKDITQLGGLITTMPITAISFLFCAFSVMGIPPFGGFFSKYMVVAGAVQGGHPIIALVFLIGAIMTILYLFRLFNLVFLGELRLDRSEGSSVMTVSVFLLAILSLAGGIFVSYPAEVARTAVVQALELVK